MTSQAMGDEQDPPAEQPGAAAGPAEGPAVGPVLNPLQRLIQQRLREQGWSYREAARRGGLPHSTIHTLATTRNLGRPPRPDTIDALAKGLDVPVSVVRAAAAQATGMHYYDDQTPAVNHGPDDHERDLLIASIDELTPQERRHVAALVDSLRARAPRDQAGG
jgi:transcriptional regulator with XRE-family HTH domain